MTIHSPFCITPSLEPGIRIGDAWLSLTYSSRPGREGRTRYQWRWHNDAGAECTADDLQSGCGGGDLRQGFSSLLSFLGAFAEAWPHSHFSADGPVENVDLFPPEMGEWATQNSDEIGMLGIELDEMEQNPFEE